MTNCALHSAELVAESTGVVGGALKRDMQQQAGYDPKVVGGYGFGVGLERLVQVRDGIEDIRDLWQPPYLGND